MGGPSITKYAISWLADPQIASTEFAGSEDLALQSIPMPKEVGETRVEMLSLNLGFVLGRASHVFKPDQAGRLYGFMDMNAAVSEPTLIVHATRSGRVVMQEEAAGKEVTFGGETVSFQHIDRVAFKPLLDTSEAVETSGLWIGDSTLSLLLGEDIARSFMSALRLCDAPTVTTAPIPRHISEVLHNCTSTIMTGDMRKLFAQAKALEYLTLLANHLTGEPPSLNDPYKESQIRQLREELDSLNGKVPPLNELAARHGMSAKTLNSGFRQMFGQTIFAYVTEQRLNDAHAALRETNIPMKVLAARVGYSHVNNFIAAFKHKFGYAPGSLRRGFVEDDEAMAG